MNATDPPETTWKMKDLSLVSVRRIRPSAQLELIRQCPELRRLHWSPRRGSFPKDKFVQSILGDTWIMLGDLCMDNTKVSDQELSTIIGGIRRITGLSVASTHFNIQSMTALRNHFHWLRRLNTADMLGIVDDTTCSEFTIQVLKSCPRLERLKAEGVSAEYLIDDGPWACERSLRILEVCFEILSDHVNHDSQQEAAMGRLMRFVNLERLDFSNGWYGQSIEFQLERGLEKLATLTALQELVLPSKMLRLSLDDVEWMIEHWRNLKSIEGSLVRNHDDPLNLVDRFSEAGISAPNLFVSLWQEGHN
ncbi:hypothetical protein BGX31_006295 [Mortierella sp. GBA43]|nr:hypothetical protein BGX31_006295 [Mortierella sp. GBA43]